MRTTVYFLSQIHPLKNHTKAQEDVITKRDNFINAHMKNIEEIIDEDLKFEISPGSQYGGANIFATLKLTYNPK